MKQEIGDQSAVSNLKLENRKPIKI